MAGAWAQKALARPILLPHEGEPVGSGFRAPETPSKTAGPREPGQTSPGSPYGERGAGGGIFFHYTAWGPRSSYMYAFFPPPFVLLQYKYQDIVLNATQQDLLVNLFYVVS